MNIQNRQLRNWVFMLYPDNNSHNKAIEIMDSWDNSLYIKHIAKYKDNGELINKEHYHCILKFENPVWLKTIINDLKLDYDTDAHLFHSVTDFKDNEGNKIFKSIDSYISYLDHQLNDNKTDKYEIDDFKGGLKNLAGEVLNRRDSYPYEKFLNLCEFIQKYKADNPFDRYSFLNWYKICCKNGYGDLFYKNWYKMRDILKPYIYE